uniref:Uncharacterized protein n=1 Tax=Meloidogyne enterolobii TaxID=390850 RepID=A0A6V7TL31_MELEN|nr:unnamed protein product [Meloidogyne enterolobii]
MRSRAESPPTSNSFPERNSTPHQKLRVRNNSFPFSSLLLYSRSSSDQLKILPNVPEDDALNTTNLTINNPRGSNISLDNDKTLVSNKEDVRRNSSACTEEFVAFTINETSKEEENNNRQQTSKFSSSKTSTTSTSPINEQQQNNIKLENNEKEEEDDEDEEEEEENEEEGGCCSSDNSYVKVIAFASTNGSNSELGTELSEFFKEVRFAPDKLTSLCTSESAVELKDQLDTFRQQESGFNQFISDLCEEEE